jgi:predicted nucleic acid-binding protein
MAPDLLVPEVADILWKRVRRQEISDEEAAATVQALGALPLQVSASWPLILLALEIACRTQGTVYDSLYPASSRMRQLKMAPSSSARRQSGSLSRLSSHSACRS